MENVDWSSVFLGIIVAVTTYLNRRAVRTKSKKKTLADVVEAIDQRTKIISNAILDHLKNDPHPWDGADRRRDDRRS